MWNFCLWHRASIASLTFYENRCRVFLLNLESDSWSVLFFAERSEIKEFYKRGTIGFEIHWELGTLFSDFSSLIHKNSFMSREFLCYHIRVLFVWRQWNSFRPHLAFCFKWNHISGCCVHQSAYFGHSGSTKAARINCLFPLREKSSEQNRPRQMSASSKEPRERLIIV